MGRLFREFAVTLSVAIAVSMVVSLTATPMMCAHLLKQKQSHGWMYRTSEQAFDRVVNLYGRTLSVALRFRAVTLVVLLATIGLNVYLFIRVPRDFSRNRIMDGFRDRLHPIRTPRFKPWTRLCCR